MEYVLVFIKIEISSFHCVVFWRLLKKSICIIYHGPLLSVQLCYNISIFKNKFALFDKWDMMSVVSFSCVKTYIGLVKLSLITLTFRRVQM